MKRLFKKIISYQSPPPSPKKTKGVIEIQEGDVKKYLYSKKNIEPDLRIRKAYIDSLYVGSGDLVEEWDNIGEMCFGNEFGTGYSVTHTIKAKATGVIEILQYPSNTYGEYNILEEGDVLFQIFPKTSVEKLDELRNARFKNTPLIKTDEFSGTKEIKWEGVAGKISTSKYYDSSADCLYFSPEETTLGHLIFTINYSSGDFLIFRYFPKYYKLTVGTKILFLLEDKTVLQFEITKQPHKHSESLNDSYIYQTQVQLTTQELEDLETKSLLKWQILFPKTEQKITGIIDDPNDHYIIQKLVKDYRQLVKEEISEYDPLTENKVDTVEVNCENEDCYLYLMIDTSNQFHKIGISNKPEYREKTLQSEKSTIEMICSKRFPSRKMATSFEQALHQTFAEKRVRGEWFELDEKDVDEIKMTLTN